jgi:2'-5' RNA ligase
LPDETVEHLAAWQAKQLWQDEQLLGDQKPRGRIVPASNLHVTLAFLGSRPAADVPLVAGELHEAALEAGQIELRPERYRETRSVGMIVCDDVGGAATAFAGDVGERLERLGLYRRESQRWLPHITVLRFKQRPRLAPPVPELEQIGVVRCALYRSALGPNGARYDVLESVGLGGR